MRRILSGPCMVLGMNGESEMEIVVCGVIVVAVLLYAFYCRINARNLIKKLNKMIDCAADGSFTESVFDESLMSATETKLWKYLTASEVSARNALEEKNKIKTLVADISHQTKTPIANILLYSELLCEEALPKEALSYVEHLNVQANKLDFLIVSLVKLSRLETGILTLHPVKGDIMPMLEQIYSQMMTPALEKGLPIELEKTDAKAVFDRKWTEEALCNILDNAVKYTEKGKIKLSVKKYEMFVCIKISDTGIGIDKEEQSKIFSRFYRSQNVSDKGGVGIGLYLTREIIMLENGYIKADSEYGKGSVFSVYLPAAR